MRDGRRYAIASAIVGIFIAAGVAATIAVARGGTTGDFAGIPPAKQTFEASVSAQDTAAAQIPPAAKDPNHTLPTLAPPEPVPTGIIDHPNSFMQYTFQNAYQQVVAGRLIQVYAGAEEYDASQGVVAVRSTSRTDLADTGSQTYLTGAKTGSLRIVSGDLNRLDLISTDGTAYTFDATNGVLARVSVRTPVSTPIPATTAPTQ